jgi:hypothetical protein
MPRFPRALVSRVVFQVQVFEAKRPNRRHLRGVLTRLCPLEVGRIAGQNDDASGRIRLERPTDASDQLSVQCDRRVEDLGDRAVLLGIASHPSERNLVEVRHLGAERQS